ncbi:hypothetical protein Entas_3104 [Enterobacter soli]|uniref:hypothetical protein n=1 Tax=Enterobacter soli TaxID=885040 RepID=UPI000223D328|nr:hypothetical protein [Enterobacter soli]AEN65827.1 hypothetical protein Entas_3104 [Enterobacter soli]
MKLTLKEMNGLLNGKCLPSDLLTGETLADYLFRKFDEARQQLEESHRALRAETTAHENTQMQMEKMAAENAGLKAGIGFFSYDSSGYYEEHDTAEKAAAFAEDSISEYRDNAPDGWSDEVESVVWGVIMQRATMTGLRPVTEDDNVAPGIEEWCDYTLLPGIETPATDAFMDDVWASAIPEGYVLVPQEMHLSSEAMEGICYHCGDGDQKFGEFTDGLLFVGDVDYGDGKNVHGLHIATADYPEEGCATICEFAAQLRKGVQS